jgi:phosphoglycerate dehydrogenase-like enzyme
MVRGSRLGIVGLGSIGKEVARLANAAGMQVWATKRRVTDVDFVDRVLPPEGLHSMLREADYLVLCVPLTQETRNLIGREELNMMKPSAHLINISRGAIVDEDSLYHVLKNSRICGASIDVFQDEKPLPKNSRFYGLPNILITSFSAYYSADSVGQVMDLFFENLRRFKAGEPLLSMANRILSPSQSLT